jgi:hypothetical protein
MAFPYVLSSTAASGQIPFHSIPAAGAIFCADAEAKASPFETGASINPMATQASKISAARSLRGMGLLSGIEFVAPKKMSLRVPFETFHRIHPAMFGQIAVTCMVRKNRRGLAARFPASHYTRRRDGTGRLGKLRTRPSSAGAQACAYGRLVADPGQE